MIRLVASVVIAALLMTGAAVTVPQVSEYGASTTTEQVAQQPATTLTGDEAAAIALAHAGLKEADALRKEYDADDGVQHWDIDFRSGDWEYDYEIHAVTGKVLKGEKEYDPVKTEKPQTSQPKQTETTTSEKLSKDKAISIALKHAGLEKSQVTRLKAEYDVDDGVPEWEVEFRVGNYEYEYEIHGKTGKIRSWDKEYDD